MKNYLTSFLLLLLLAPLVFASKAQTARPKTAPANAGDSTLLITADADCNWKLDGVAQGRMNADDAKTIKTTAGEHLIQATTADGEAKWQDTVTADPSAQKVIRILLADKLSTWTDPATWLMWAKKDNGSDVTWQQAHDYCQNLTLGGRSEWRLPEIDELGAIYDPTVGQLEKLPNGVSIAWHTKGDLHPSGWTWSNTAGDESGGHAWTFRFTDGSRYSDGLGYSWGIRALCVRRSGK